MIERPFFFGGGPASLFGVFHEAGASTVREPFVFCHPFAEEKLWTHRTFVLFARRLASLGHPVLRFDFMGNGDSLGSFSESSVQSMLADVRTAIGECGRLTGQPQVTLLGLRFGASIASLAAEQLPEVSRLVLWAPIVDGGRYMQDLLRVNVTTQAAVYAEVRSDRETLVKTMRDGQTVNIDGYELSYPLYTQVSAVQLTRDPVTFKGPCLFVQVDRGERPAPDLDAMAARYDQPARRFAREEPFWKEIPRSYQRAPENLFGVTEAWLSEGLTSHDRTRIV